MQQVQVSLNMLVKKLVSALAQVASVLLVVLFVAAMLLILVLYPFIKCSKVLSRVAARVASGAVQLLYITPFGTWKSKTCSSSKTTKEQKTTVKSQSKQLIYSHSLYKSAKTLGAFTWWTWTTLIPTAVLMRQWLLLEWVIYAQKLIYLLSH